MTTERSYTRVSTGRPSPLRMTSVFLLAPSAHFKTNWNIPMHKLLAASKMPWLAPVWRCFESVTPPSQLRLERMKQRFSAQMSGMAPESVPELFKLLVASDPAVPSEIADAGHWETLRSGMFDPTDRFQRLNLLEADHYVDVEQASSAAYRLLRSADFLRAASSLRESEICSQYFLDDSLDRFAAAKAINETMLARLSALVEHQLALTARTDCFMARELDRTPFGGHLFGYASGSPLLPGRQFMAWLMKEVGAPTQEKLLEKFEDRVDVSTVKRWCSGAKFPDPDRLWVFLEGDRDPDNESEKAASNSTAPERWRLVYFLAMRFDKLLRLCWALRSEHPDTKDWALRDPDDWMKQRYANWVAVWRAREGPR